MKKVGTLKELDVKPGDVLQWEGGEHFPCEVVEIDKFIVHMETPNGHLCYNLQYCCIPWVVISRASDKPKIWRDMTDAEKGALLLAHHEGKVIEGRNESWPNDEWVEIRVPSWWNYSAYRVRPEPKVDTVKQGYKTNSSGKFVTTSALDHATHVVTFNLIDGKPDYASIKMEPVE